jgi:hypothetical protein
MSPAETHVRDAIGEGNFLVDPAEPHMEVLDTQTREVWQSRLPVSRDEYDAMVIDAPLIKIGIGCAAMDAHYFRRSPGAAHDGPVRLREISGRVFLFCAMPDAAGPTRPFGPEGPSQLIVNKFHTVHYGDERPLQWIRLPDGRDFVHVIEGGPDKAPLALPEGWIQRREHLNRPLTIHLPAPTTVFFFRNGDSYQGPVDFNEEKR